MGNISHNHFSAGLSMYWGSTAHTSGLGCIMLLCTSLVAVAKGRMQCYLTAVSSCIGNSNL